MFKENFNQQSTAPKIEVEKNPDFENEQILEKAQEAISEIEDAVTLAVDTKESGSESKKSLLEFLRSGIARKFIQTAAAFGLFVGSHKFSQAENSSVPNEGSRTENAITEQSQESELARENVEKQDSLVNPTPESYDLSKICSIDSTNLENQGKAAHDKVIAQSFVKKEIVKKNVRLLTYQIFDLKGKLLEFKKDQNQEGIESTKKQIADLAAKREAFQSGDVNVEYSQEDLNIIDDSQLLMLTLQLTKDEVIKSFEGEHYVKKLMSEFGIDRQEALKHQQTRINNVKNIEVEFRFAEDISKDVKNAAAYFTVNTNKIVIPMDGRTFQFDLFKHELIHAAVNAYGLSAKEVQLLEGTFAPQERSDSIGSRSANEYFKDVAERYVRLQVLKQELIDLGIMDRDGKFTEKTYQKMMKQYYETKANPETNVKLNKNALDFIEFTKDFADSEKGYENFSKLFNELAANSQEQGGTYHHPGWDYSGTEQSV